MDVLSEDYGTKYGAAQDMEKDCFLTHFVPLEPDEKVLSDVHIFADSSPDQLDDRGETVISRFPFSDNTTPSEETSCNMKVDSDGDLVLPDRADVLHVLKIEHKMATELADVGSQVWRGALFLGDFILSNKELFNEQVVIELGAGVGLVALVLSFVGCKTVFPTDYSHLALEICRKNQLGNTEYAVDQKEFRIRQLDWFKRTFAGEDDFRWTSEDLDQLRSGFTVVAADIIYSDDITNAFFETLFWLSDYFRASFTVYLSMEKRLNFTIDDMQVCSPPYRTFLRNIEQYSTAISPRLIARQLGNEFRQHFQYKRVDELELWHFDVLAPPTMKT